MTVILREDWTTTNAERAANPRGAPLPRHAAPLEVPYHPAMVTGESIAGSVILPVCRFTGLDHSGADTGHSFCPYGQVIVNETAIRKLEDAGLIDDETVIYTNMHECREQIRAMNTKAHEDYLAGYAQGRFSAVSEWKQEKGAAQKACEIIHDHNTGHLRKNEL